MQSGKVSNAVRLIDNEEVPNDLDLHLTASAQLLQAMAGGDRI